MVDLDGENYFNPMECRSGGIIPQALAALTGPVRRIPTSAPLLTRRKSRLSARSVAYYKPALNSTH